VKWPEIRAGLILLAIFFALVDGCPLPEKTSHGFIEPIRDAQQLVLTPMSWVRPTLRIAQRWALYQAPTSNGFRLWVEGQDRNAQWHVLFRAGDDEHQDDARVIDSSRPRGAWNATDVPPYQYGTFAKWIAVRVLARHPDFILARIRFEQVRTGPDGMEPTGQFVATHLRGRGDR
jgi:hypothetical protein